MQHMTCQFTIDEVISSLSMVGVSNFSFCTAKLKNVNSHADKMTLFHLSSCSILQRNEAGSSNAMELFGLKKCLEFLKNSKIVVGKLVTDRHPSIAKLMREEHSKIRHRYDLWHIAKSKLITP